MNNFKICKPIKYFCAVSEQIGQTIYLSKECEIQLLKGWKTKT